ncbi:MAG: sigma-70 family RNA polymerase sigma factor [Planctomycetota bacterium]|nr:sigma-70 family RNA polymerase sigma factor [Planctomycetota bacterium]
MELPATSNGVAHRAAARAQPLNGDARASQPEIHEALNRYEVPLVRYALRLTGNLECARDLVQETFLRLCNEPAIASQPYLAQWLFTVCRRLACDVRRQESRMKSYQEQSAVMTPPVEPPEAVAQEEQLSRVLSLLGSLPSNQQEVVRLKFQNQFSYKEISTVTGLTVTNVGFLLHTALKTLRERLKSMDLESC